MNLDDIPAFMVIDVESVGLHGEGFAVAWVVVAPDGRRLDEGCLACNPDLCAGTDESRLWVAENVPPIRVTSHSIWLVRSGFWEAWRRWAELGAVLAADCAWPVEANFLGACVQQNHAEREWQGPYPLLDVASIVLALGGEPLAAVERLADELPAHHPLNDARQSARILGDCLKARSARSRPLN